MPSIGAVVINFNGGDCVINTVYALHQQDVSLEKIIVVDSGSTDGSPERIQEIFEDVQIVKLSKDKGPSKARNVGLELCTTDLVLLVDDDVYVAEDCISYMLELFNREKPTVICPRVILYPELNIVQSDGAEAHFVGTMVLRNGYLPVKTVQGKESIVGGCISACLLVDRHLVLKAGGFDEEYFFYMEDLEFCIRLRSLGHRIIFEPYAVAYHDRGIGTPGLSFRGKGKYPSRRAYLMIRNRLMTIMIHYKTRTLAVLLPALAIYELASLVMVLFKGWLSEWVWAWRWQIRNKRAVLLRRTMMQQIRALNDGDLLVGGPPPLTPGLLNSNIALAAFNTLSEILNWYWHICKHWIG